MKEKQKNKVLILGGTAFVGRQLVEALMADKSMEVYLFNRGKTNSDLFPEAKRIVGDRETKDIEQLSEHHWDYVVDFSSYYPHSLQRTLDVINKDVKKYIYISTISVYSFEHYKGDGEIDEQYPIKEYEEAQLTEPTLTYYGEKKVACEDVLEKATWLNAVVLRPCIIYGKYDPTNRFYYWLERIKKEKRILVPADKNTKIHLSYSGDLVAIIKECLLDNIPPSTYNVTTHKAIPFVEMLNMMKSILKSNCEFELVDKDWLDKENVNIARAFPLCAINNLVFDHTKISNSLSNGFIPFEESLRTTINYYDSQGWQEIEVGLPKEQEKVLLQKRIGK